MHRHIDIDKPGKRYHEHADTEKCPLCQHVKTQKYAEDRHKSRLKERRRGVRGEQTGE